MDYIKSGSGTESISTPCSHFCLAFQGTENRLNIFSMFNFSQHKKETFDVTMQPRIKELKRRHASLDDAIDGEINRPIPDQAALAELKKQKLKILLM